MKKLIQEHEKTIAEHIEKANALKGDCKKRLACIYTAANMLFVYLDEHADALSKAQQEHEKAMQAHHEKLKALQGKS